LLEKNRTFLYKGCKGKNVPKLINVVMQLRKVCNHPYLVKGCEEKHTQGLSIDKYYEHLVRSSGKLILLDKLLPRLKARGHKVLIFSQMVRILNLLETYLVRKGYIFERLDGGVRGNERQSAIDRFCRPESDRFIFLLCTRAGGVGINLAAADIVIIYDSDWNPQNDIQAQARCHRIGQTQEVKVYRLLTSKTYERFMFERASKKLGLDQVVLNNMGFSQDPSKQLDDKEIDSLLRYGAYDLFREIEQDGEQEEKAFNEEDIDKILERSSKVIWNPTGPGASTFAKASFQSRDSEAGIDLEAEDFWERVLPDEKNATYFNKKLDSGFAVKKEKKRILKTTKEIG